MKRPKTLSTQLHELFCHGCTSNYIARQLQTDLNLSISDKRVQQLHLSNGHMVDKIIALVPVLTKNHKKARYECHKEHVI